MWNLEEKRKGKSFSRKSRQFLAAVREAVRRGSKKDTTAIVSHTRARATPCTCKSLPESGSTVERTGGGTEGRGQNEGVVGSGGENGRGKGGGSRNMNEAECVLAIANGLCQAFRDLATAVLNPRMHAVISSPRSLANFTRPGLKNVKRKERREATVVTRLL